MHQKMRTKSKGISLVNQTAISGVQVLSGLAPIDAFKAASKAAHVSGTQFLPQPAARGSVQSFSHFRFES
jgi:hypothetical protein